MSKKQHTWFCDIVHLHLVHSGQQKYHRSSVFVATKLDCFTATYSAYELSILSDGTSQLNVLWHYIY